MKKIISSLFLIAGMCAAAASSAAVISGHIGMIDGDKDGRIDDSKIARVQFTVTAGTSIFFDSLVLEASNVDLNGDGEITGFDNYMALLKGNSWLLANDDSWSTFGDGSNHHYDSTLDYYFAEAGTYMVTLGQLSYGLNAAVRGYDLDRQFYGVNGNMHHAAWRLNMTVSRGSVSGLHEVGVAAIPEPTSIALLGLGLFGIAAARRKSGKSQA